MNDSEQYVLSVLAKKLKEQGHVVSTGYDSSFTLMDYNIPPQINSSNLFIGLITASGNANNRVLQEWNHAISRRIPSLLLIENRVPINPPYYNDPNIIVFDRLNPEPSIEMVRNKINSSRQAQLTNTSGNNAWLIGGLALLALIGLLSSEDK